MHRRSPRPPTRRRTGTAGLAPGRRPRAAPTRGGGRTGTVSPTGPGTRRRGRRVRLPPAFRRLTPDPARHAERALAAVGRRWPRAPSAGPGICSTPPTAGPLDAPGRAQADLLRARITFVGGLGDDAPAVLIRAAETLTPLDPGLARELPGCDGRLLRGPDRGSGINERDLTAVRALPPVHPPGRPAARRPGAALHRRAAAAAPALRGVPPAVRGE